MPTDILQISEDAILDAYPGYENTNYQNANPLEAYVYNGHLTYPILKVADVSSYVGKQINSAKIRIFVNGLSLISNWTNGIHIDSVDGTWSEATVTFNNKPAFGAVATQKVAMTGYGYFELDITTIFQRWITVANYGLVMYGESGYSPASVSYFKFASSEDATDKPTIIVDWSNVDVGTSATSRYCSINSTQVRISKDWSISDTINDMSSFNCTLVDKLNLASLDVGMSIDFYNANFADPTKHLYSGIITDIVAYEDTPNHLEFLISAYDNCKLADKRLIGKAYVNFTASNLAREIIAILATEGVIEGNLTDGETVVLSKAQFNYIKCSEALNKIKSSTNLNWKIDKEKKLNLFNRSRYSAPFLLNNAIVHHNFQHKKNMDGYRNVQYIRGGRSKTELIVNEMFQVPDGVSRSYTTRYPVAKKPSLQVNLNGAGWVDVPYADIAINGLDRTGKWWWSFNSNVISLGEDQTPLATVDRVRITYFGLRNLFIVKEDDTKITARSAIEGGSGRHENLQVEIPINETNQALEFAQGLIDTHDIKDYVSFNTVVDGLEAGQLLRVTKPLFNLDEDFLIDNINIKAFSPTTLEYQVKALDGTSVGGWTNFFKKLIEKTKEFEISDDETIIKLHSDAESYTTEGAITVTKYTTLRPNTSLYPSNTLYPNTAITGTVILND